MNYKIVFTGIIFIMLYASLLAQDVSVMTFNIRYDNPNDGINSWPNRKEMLVSLIKENNAGIIGIQEALDHQLEYLNKELADYTYYGVGREDGDSKGEYCAIFYDDNQYRLLESGTFWLSETPSVVSVGWDAALCRICSYIQLVDVNSKDSLWVFNTHFDHRGEIAREKSAELILQKLKEIVASDQSMILMGDFNATSDENAIELILDSSLKNATSFSQSTFNGFGDSYDPKQIDFIFYENLNLITDTIIHFQEKDGKYVSDHYPVFAEFIKN